MPGPYLFSARSKQRLRGAHPLLQKVMNAAIVDFDFSILESQRNKADQEKAFKGGFSKARFGQSSHNWTPALALDVGPYPLDWNDIAAFKALAKVIRKHAKALKVDLVWGGDWTMRDYPHWELKNWRELAKTAKPYRGL
jgi:peptidoglycan L-alanyl-D-glutamate endopeptidase CwlK